jgi:TctA family transporter
MLENSLSKPLIVSRTGSPLFFFTRPISGILLTLAILVLANPMLRWWLRWGMRRPKPTAIA